MDVVNLKRTIGLPTGCSLIIGGIIGSGIFVSPQGVLIGAGSYGLSLIIWATCGLISLLGALTYAEIGTTIPKSGAAYYALMEIYGDGAAFVYMFTMVFFVLPASTAIVTLTFAEYLAAIFFNDGCGPAPMIITRLIATTLILLLAAVNIKSVSASGNVSVFFTLAKIFALVIIIIGGMVYLGQGKTDHLHPENSFKDTSTNVASLAEAFLSGMWAYSGWDGLNFLIEEIKQPERNLPLAIIISVPVVTVVYILTNISYFAVLTSHEIIAAPAVAMTWANSLIASVSWFVPLAVAVSTFGAAMGSLLLKSRLIYVSARENHLPQFFAMVHISLFTPIPAVMFLAVLTLVFIHTGTITALIGYTMIALWVFHGMVGFGLLWLRYKKPELHRPYKVPLICPVILVLFSLLLTLAPIIGNPQWGYFFAVSIILAGLLTWLLCIHYHIQIPGTGKITEIVQLYSEVSPSEVSPNEVSLSEVVPCEVSPNEDLPSDVSPSDVSTSKLCESVTTKDKEETLNGHWQKHQITCDTNAKEAHSPFTKSNNNCNTTHL